MKKRGLAILGSTGSIGKQALEIVRKYKDLFDIELLTANNNYQLLSEQAKEFDANNVVICNNEKYKPLKEQLKDTDTKVFTGMQSICELVQSHNVDIVLTAMVGFSGLKPTISAIEASKVIALANKETLVAAGSYVMDLAIKKEAYIIPVDSEHSAIFQCLMGAHNNKPAKIHLTASGGPFRLLEKKDIQNVTKEQALKHPRWTMGNKITIDSATMMNKGFEMIEAKWLFNVEPQNINVIIHPQSIIHSMIEYNDGAVIAQMGNPDMKEPIQFALCFPERKESDVKKLNFSELQKLEFSEPDFNKFPCLKLAFNAIEKGGNIPCAMNAANEACVAAFLSDKIGFYDISDIIQETMENTKFIEVPTLYDIFSTNDISFKTALEIIEQKHSR